MRRGARGVAVLVLGGAACGGTQRGANDDVAQGFDCNGRMVGYVAHGTLGADEIGVAIDCAERGPELVRWRVERDGTRADDKSSITPDEFETLWHKVQDTGWRDLQDCTAGADTDPVYNFSFHQADAEASFACQSASPPFPYHTIIDVLDAVAARGRELGPDVPDVPAAPAGKGRGHR